MDTDPSQLLRQLEPAVLPAYARGEAQRPDASVEHGSFEDLLAAARRGRVESGRPVGVGFAATEPLTAGQLARLAPAADLAEASGSRRALLLLDGRGLVLDVARRTLVAELAAGGEAQLVRLDAAVHAGGDGRAAFAPLPPPGGPAPRGVAEQIEAARRAADSPRRPAA